MCDEIQRFLSDLVEACNSHDLDRVATFYTPDYEGVDVAEAQPQRGLQGLLYSLGRYFTAFPDLQMTAGDTIIQGDRVAHVWTASGTHRGALLHIPPTGRRVTTRGMSLLTLRDGKVSRGIYIWDLAGMLRSIGLLPEL